MAENQIDVGMRHELTAVVDRVGVAGRPDARSLDDFAHRAEVEVGDDDAMSRRAFGQRCRHVRLRPALEVDRPEVLLVGACADECGAS